MMTREEAEKELIAMLEVMPPLSSTTVPFGFCQ